MRARTRTTWRWAAPLVLLAAGTVAACGDDDAVADQAGALRGPAEAGAIVLRVGTNDGPERPAGEQLVDFAERVEELSGGTIEVEPVWQAAGQGVDQWDQRVARLVLSGELDMALVPTRAWDTEGVTSLRALSAPMLIQTDEVTADVIRGDLADELMSGLEEIGVTGLSLIPEGMRHVYGFDGPMLSLEDFEGAVVRAPASDTVAQLFEAWGATVTDDDPDSALQDAMESSYHLDPPGVATGNLTLFPKVSSLVIGSNVFDDLSDEDQAVLRQAAHETRDRAIESSPSDLEAARSFCDAGRGVALAEPEAIEALSAAAEPVRADIAADELGAELIEEIEAIVAATPAPSGPIECEPAEVETIGTPEQASALNGTYRYEITEDDLRSAGVTDANEIRENVGVFTWTLADGAWRWEQEADHPIGNASDSGTFSVDGDRMLVVIPSLGAGTTLLFTVTDDGDLEVDSTEFLGPVIETFCCSKTWDRVG